jgi:chromosome segregation ATPase
MNIKTITQTELDQLETRLNGWKELYKALQRVTVELQTYITQLKATINSMEHDAIDNTFTIRNLLEVNKAQAAEIAALKRELNTCKHAHVNIHSRLFAAETREEPADYEQSAQCQDCGKWLAIEDIPEDSEVSE